MEFYSGRERSGKWEFVAKKQGGGQLMENHWEETSGIREVLAKLTEQDSCCGQAKVIRHYPGMVEVEESDQILKWGVVLVTLI